MTKTGALAVGGDGAGGGLLSDGRLSRASPAVSSFAADRRHVCSIAADGLSTLPTGDPRFVGSKFVSCSFGVRSSPAFAGDFTLFGPIHGRKTALARICHSGFSLSFNLILRGLRPCVRQT